MRDSKTCAVFLGPSRLGPWQKEEIQVAIGQRVGDPEFHVIPVLLPGAERPRRGDVALLDFLINGTWVEFARTLDEEQAFNRLVCGIKGLKHDHRRGREIDPNRCPYRGLEAFRPDDAAFFFGRANLTTWLVSDLRRELRSAQGVRLLAVLGPSGSGKSSVVLAGLVPGSRRGRSRGASDGRSLSCARAPNRSGPWPTPFLILGSLRPIWARKFSTGLTSRRTAWSRCTSPPAASWASPRPPTTCS